MSATVMGGSVGNHELFKAPKTKAPNATNPLAPGILPNTTEKIAASDAELARVVAEARKIASRSREQNKNYSDLSRRSPFISRWETWMADSTKVGLPNPGDLCYRNVIFQILAHTPALIHWAYWYSKHHIPEGRLCEVGDNGSICKPCYLHAFLTGYWDNREGRFDVQVENLWTVLFNGWRTENKEGQQDPAEFFQDIFYQIWGDVKPVFKFDFLELFSADLVGARQCKGSGCCKTLDYQYHVGLPVLPIRFAADSKIKTISEAFETHMGEEAPVGRCEKCHCDQVEKLYISKPAEVFTIQLNRTETDGTKIENPIMFNDMLTIRGEYFDSAPGSGSPPNIAYELTAVVLHTGKKSHEGHYTVIVRGRTNIWTLIDDTTTTPISFGSFSKDVQNQKNAYMFVYTRRDRHPTDDKMLRYYKIFTLERHRKERGQPEPDERRHKKLDWTGRTPPLHTTRTMTQIIMGDESEEVEESEDSSSRDSASYFDSEDEDSSEEDSGEEEGVPMEVEYVQPAVKQPIPTVTLQPPVEHVPTMTSRGTQTDEAWPQPAVLSTITVPSTVPSSTGPSTGPSLHQPIYSTPEPPNPLKRPLMTNDDFGQVPEHVTSNAEGILRIQYFKYKTPKNRNDPLEYEIPLDFAVRGFPINMLEDPMEGGIRQQIKKIFKDQKTIREILDEMRESDSESD